ncbi:unnamed protein product [Hyaloperonospora brassicae]|uniref:RxLR effector candidate protein n=1 Tax=Hyaloperonospora brassicae TaxID=162125 RepID=A0AAV0UQ79_HYABA|nr:unnamed protein product [Hyaloperonospora brassicae]
MARWTQLLVLAVVVSAGSGARLAPVTEKLDDVTSPDLRYDALSGMTDKQFSLRADGVRRRIAGEERGASEIGTKLEESLAGLKSKLSMQAMKDFHGKGTVKLQKWYKAVRPKVEAVIESLIAKVQDKLYDLQAWHTKRRLDKGATVEELAELGLQPVVVQRALGIPSVRYPTAYTSEEMEQNLKTYFSYVEVYYRGTAKATAKEDELDEVVALVKDSLAQGMTFEALLRWGPKPFIVKRALDITDTRYPGIIVGGRLSKESRFYETYKSLYEQGIVDLHPGFPSPTL